MKRIFLLIPLLFALLAFAGCSSADDSDTSASDLEKAQAIAVIDPSGTTLQTITDQSAIKDFVAALDVDHWELIDLPAGAKEVGQFGLSQKKPSTSVKKSTTIPSTTSLSSPSTTPKPSALISSASILTSLCQMTLTNISQRILRRSYSKSSVNRV